MFEKWPVAVIIAVVLAFAFLFWLVEYKGIVPSEVGFGSAKVKFTETQTKEPEPSAPANTNTANTTTPETSATKPSQPAAQSALHKPEATPDHPTATTQNTPPKPAGLSARQAMTKYFQYLQDGQYPAAHTLFKVQENGTKQTLEEFETFWKAIPDFKWTITKDYESGNFAWVDLTLHHSSFPKPQLWKYSFRRSTQVPELKPFGYWGVSNIESIK
ncbi:hypothetical protein [Thiofilum flexile]|uniref:hypothetical protein n=1 Tax=Thiofilum flexile TaxID=125627 RepID=UPI0003646A45|nr:hypothetical protein [Thiofilum flexile]